MGVISKISVRAIFLDRDGVINKAIIKDGKPYPPLSIENVVILPNVKKALNKLKSSGFILIVVTNQPDVARGKTNTEEIETINNYINNLLPIDEFVTCYHDDSDECECRKPKPGMILHAARKHNIDLTSSFMIGDRWRDVEAGINAGCRTIFIDYKYKEKQPQKYDHKVRSLYESVNLILSD